MLEGVELYDYEDQVVLYLVNLEASVNRLETALTVLDNAIEHRPDNYRLWWGKGLIYRRMGKLEEAIECFRAASDLAPDESKIYYHIGIIYYNQGITLREASLKIKNNSEYKAVRDQAREKFLEAVKWMEESYEIDPQDEQTISILYQLYYQLQMKDKEETMRKLIR